MRIRDAWILVNIRARNSLEKFGRDLASFDLKFELLRETLDPIGLSPLITGDPLLNRLFESKILMLKIQNRINIHFKFF